MAVRKQGKSHVFLSRKLMPLECSGRPGGAPWTQMAAPLGHLHQSTRALRNWWQTIGLNRHIDLGPTSERPRKRALAAAFAVPLREALGRSPRHVRCFQTHAMQWITTADLKKSSVLFMSALLGWRASSMFQRQSQPTNTHPCLHFLFRFMYSASFKIPRIRFFFNALFKSRLWS